MDHQALKELIDYDPETGVAVWRKSGDRVGKPWGGTKRTNSKEYRAVYIKDIGRHKQFSHVVHFYMTGRWPIAEMDHINGNTLDDRWVNLRECTRAQNEANRGARRTNKTGFRGVYPEGRIFRAAIHRSGSRVNLGKFATAVEAHTAYLAAARQHDGEFLCAA